MQQPDKRTSESDSESQLKEAQTMVESKSDALIGDTSYNKFFEGIPPEWHETIKVFNDDTKRAKLYFRCKIRGCDSVFRKSCNLRDHFRKHTSMRPFQCEICDKQFTQSGNLGRHLKNVHSISRSIRNKDFKQKPISKEICISKSQS